MKKIRTYLKTLLVAASLALIPLAAAPVSAINVFQGCGSSTGTTTTGAGAAAGTGVAQTGSSSTTSSGSPNGVCGAASQDDFSKLMTNVINTILLVLGMIAVIMIIIGGIRYTTSNGDPSQVKSAKDTVLYAVVGLIIAIMAFAIVNFVLASLKK